MELLYLCKKTRKNNLQQIDFGSEYSFNLINNKLEIKRNQHFISDFYTNKNLFSKENAVIKNFSLVVGQNGSGKTEILQSITNFCNQTYYNDAYYDGFMVVVVKDSSNKIVIYRYSEDIVIVNEESISNLKVIKKRVPDSTDFFVEEKKYLDDTYVIYCSNVFDTAEKSIGQNVFDVSTNANVNEINTSNKRILANKRRSNYGLFDRIDLPKQLKLKDNKDKIEYFSSEFYKNNFFDFNKPVRLVVNHQVEISQSLEKYNEILDLEISKFIKEYFPQPDIDQSKIIERIKSKNHLILKELISNKQIDDKYLIEKKGIIKVEELLISFKISSALQIFKNKYNTLEAYLNNIHKEGDDGYSPDVFILKIFYDFYDIVIASYLSFPSFFGDDSKILKNFLDILSSQDELFNHPILNGVKKEAISKSTIKGWKQVQQLVEYLEENNNIDNFGNIIFDDINKLKQWYFNLYKNSALYSHNYFDVYFDHMSSGQTAIMNIFSRIYSVFNNVSGRKNILILIDEIELYLHPQWQKEIVYNIIDFVEKLFVDKNVQIIATSNNAIPVSDFLKPNVILLGKENNAFDEQRKTFGGNIFNIFSDNFFVQNGFIGDFSKKKINDLIEILDKESIEYLTENMDLIERQINSIGENLIKNKLLEILQDRLSANLLSIRSALNEFNDRLNKLENNE